MATRSEVLISQFLQYEKNIRKAASLGRPLDEYLKIYMDCQKALDSAYEDFYGDHVATPTGTPVHSGAYDGFRDWGHEGWRLPSRSDQSLTFLNLKTWRCEAHTVAPHGTSLPKPYVAISHLWDDDMTRGRGNSRFKAYALMWAVVALHKYQSESKWQYTRGNEWEYDYLWMDVISTNQQSADGIRAATYAMSYAYHCAEVTLVDMIGDQIGSEHRWHTRIWTLQEAYLCWWLVFVNHYQVVELQYDDKSGVAEGIFDETVLKLRTEKGNLPAARDVIAAARKRSAYYEMDKLYALTNLLSGCGQIKATYDHSYENLQKYMTELITEAGDKSIFGLHYQKTGEALSAAAAWFTDEFDPVEIETYDRRRGAQLIAFQKDDDFYIRGSKTVHLCEMTGTSLLGPILHLKKPMADDTVLEGALKVVAFLS
ncbi:hypothetical protein HDU76_013101 [Blyttiomyces sp. JEL0837]|nr:hypothetical protein HDU76_013101 [Blyttiomyces sp. JEL0837]